jgi:hypothetical protein
VYPEGHAASTQPTHASLAPLTTGSVAWKQHTPADTATPHGTTQTRENALAALT